MFGGQLRVGLDQSVPASLLHPIHDALGHDPRQRGEHKLPPMLAQRCSAMRLSRQLELTLGSAVRIQMASLLAVVLVFALCLFSYAVAFMLAFGKARYAILDVVFDCVCSVSRRADPHAMDRTWGPRVQEPADGGISSHSVCVMSCALPTMSNVLTTLSNCGLCADSDTCCVDQLINTFRTLRGPDYFDTMWEENRLLGPLFFFSWTLIGAFVLINLFVVVLLDSIGVSHTYFPYATDLLFLLSPSIHLGPLFLPPQMSCPFKQEIAWGVAGSRRNHR